MQLIGMLDSPYVRRVAISLRMRQLPFEHRAISVFSTFDEFKAINPVVKAPSLVCDDGTVLMDSSLILDYLESLPSPRRSLMPPTRAERQHALRVMGLALAACDKAVQIVYEHQQRPADKLHQPWLDRVSGQLRAACDLLEKEASRQPLVVNRQSGITSAVVWRFLQMNVPTVVVADDHPCLKMFSVQAEATPEFLATPPV